MKKPRRLFRSRRNEADIVVVTEANGRNIILGDPDLSDLQGYSKEIRSRWWKAYREEGVSNPIVVAVHKRSTIACERGLTEGSEFTFLAIDTHGRPSYFANVSEEVLLMGISTFGLGQRCPALGTP